MAKFIEFASTAALDNQLAGLIVERLTSAIAHNGRAGLVISGGRTPQGLFKALNQSIVDWSKVVITLADERWVDVDAAASNEKSVRQSLLQGSAAAAHFISLKSDASSPSIGAKEIEQRLSMLPLPLDVVILGMGEDGHTASLFPGADNLAQALSSQQHCIAITSLTAPYERITLTLPTLLNSRHIYVHITGQNKKEVYQQAESGEEINEMPIRAVLHQKKVPVEVFWAP